MGKPSYRNRARYETALVAYARAVVTLLWVVLSGWAGTAYWCWLGDAPPLGVAALAGVSAVGTVAFVRAVLQFRRGHGRWPWSVLWRARRGG